MWHVRKTRPDTDLPLPTQQPRIVRSSFFLNRGEASDGTRSAAVREIFRVPGGCGRDFSFAVTWAKMYGKGRVYYTTLGHVETNWDKAGFQQMMTEAIKWAMGLENADVTSRPLPKY